MNLGSRRRAARIVVFAVAALGLVVPAPHALATHGTRTLDIVAETGSAPTGSPVNIDIKVSAPAAAGTSIFVDVEITGPNDTDASDTPLTPDKSCEILATTDTCQVSYTPGAAGVDTFRAWIDESNTPSETDPSEADLTEGPNEDQKPGTTPEPDNTDVVIRVINTATPPPTPRTLNCKNPATGEIDATDSSLKPNSGPSSIETYTCTVLTTGSVNVPNVVIDAELEGPNDVDNTVPDFTCTTTLTTGCNISVPGAELQPNSPQGTALVCFWIDDPSDDGVDAVSEANGGACPERWDTPETGSGEDIPSTDVVRITWEEPRPTTLDITGDGPDVSIDLSVTQQAALAVSLKDQFGNNLENRNIDFKVLTGPNRSVTATAQFECTTAADGTCTGTLVSGPNHFNGLDKICAWLDANTDNVYAPAGDVADGGGCATEPASPDNDDGGLTDRGEVRWANGNPAPTRLEMTPETGSPRASTSPAFTVTLIDEQDAAMEDEFIDFEITGVGDPDSSDTPDSPDVPGCTTGSNGQCVLNFTSNVTGNTQIRAWVDLDDDNQAVADGEVDTTEGPDAGEDEEPMGGNNQPGTVEEGDTTDVVAVTWTASTTSVTLSYSQSVIVYGGSLTLSGELKAGTQTLPGKRVIIQRKLRGASSFATVTSVTTDAAGKFRWTGRPGSSAEWKASYLGDPPALLGSGSPIRYVGVRVSITIASNTPSAPRGSAIVFTGKVLPVHYQKRVYLQVAGPNNSWKNVATTLCDGAGGYRMTYRRNVPGALIFRTFYVAQDLDHGGNWTRGIGVRWT